MSTVTLKVYNHRKNLSDEVKDAVGEMLHLSFLVIRCAVITNKAHCLCNENSQETV